MPHGHPQKRFFSFLAEFAKQLHATRPDLSVEDADLLARPGITGALQLICRRLLAAEI